MYHGLHSEKYPCKYSKKSELYWIINTVAFRRQMEILAQKGFNTSLLSDFLGNREKRAAYKKPIVITFDDGHETNYFNALPILNEFGFKAEFFITADWIDNPGFMNRKQLLLLKENGMSVQSHALTHNFLTTLNDERLVSELTNSKEKIKQIINSDVKYLSYPGGRYDDRTEKFVSQAGYQGSCISDHGYNTVGKNPFRLKRFGISVATTEHYFTAVVNRDINFLIKHKIKHFAAVCIRMLLGNKGFEKLKSYKR